MLSDETLQDFKRLRAAGRLPDRYVDAALDEALARGTILTRVAEILKDEYLSQPMANELRVLLRPWMKERG